MSSLKPPSPYNIPVLSDVVVPGRGRAARGQMALEERRASDLTEPEPPVEEVEAIEEFPAVEAVEADEIDESALYEDILGTSPETLDVEGVIDRVLDKHAQQLRDELRAEFERLLEQARKTYRRP